MVALFFFLNVSVWVRFVYIESSSDKPQEKKIWVHRYLRRLRLGEAPRVIWCCVKIAQATSSYGIPRYHGIVCGIPLLYCGYCHLARHRTTSEGDHD